MKTRFAFIVIVLFVFAGTAGAAHDVYLSTSNTVPSYCQETSNWCGAATSQMILEGYPSGVEHPFAQSYIWSRIQAHKDDSTATPGWASDPDGVKDTLMELGGDPGVSWSIFSNTNSQSLMYSVAYWMTSRHFPSAALVNTGGSPYGSFQHWIVIDGFTTDVDPASNSAVTLQSIEIVDPWNPPCATATHGGVRSLISGSTWYSFYWDVPGNLSGSKWNGKYVAVVEPPLKEGIVKSPKKQVAEGKIISPSAATEYAVKWTKEFKLDQKRNFTLLKNNKPLKPLLVNAKHKAYYIVPLGYSEGQLSQGAVIVNAYDGDFQEIGVFQKPIKYLSKERAVKLALSSLCACKETKNIRAQLIFRYSEQTQSRFLPVWEISYMQQTVYVTMNENIIHELTTLAPGD